MWEGREGDGNGSTREEEEDRKVQENVVGNRIIAIFCQHVFIIFDIFNPIIIHKPKMTVSTGHMCKC